MTTPVSPITTVPVPAPQTIFAKDYTWLVHHAVLLIITGVLVIAGVLGVENLMAKHDAAKAAEYAALLAQANANTQAIQKQLAADEDHWSTVQTQLLHERQTLENTIAKQNAELEKQKQVDATLSAQAAADRLAMQTQAEPGEIQVVGNNVTLDLPITRRVVASLDTLVSTQTELQNTKAELTTETTLYGNAQAQVAEQKTLVAAQQSQLAAAGKSCDSRVKVASGGRFKTFLKGVGVGVGLTLTAVIGHIL